MKDKPFGVPRPAGDWVSAGKANVRSGEGPLVRGRVNPNKQEHNERTDPTTLRDGTDVDHRPR
jgi:hypothetical protein